MGQSFSSCTHSSFDSSNYGDYEKLKSEEDTPIHKKNKSQKNSYSLEYKDSYPELHFPFELRKRITLSFPLTNPTDDYMAFFVMGSNPKKYSVDRSSIGVVMPMSTYDIKVKMQAQVEAPPNMQCKDLFVFKTIFLRRATTKYITPEMFEKNSGYEVKELIMRVVYVAPPKQPSRVQERSDKK